MKAVKLFISAVAAGAMVGIGGTAYLSAPDRNIGMVLFAIGLLTICTYGFRLYTGSIGYLLIDRQTPWTARLTTGVIIWVGNYVGTTVYGSMLHIVKPEIAAKAAAMCEIKLDQGMTYNLFMGALCGLLMYLAVDFYKRESGFARFLGIFFAVPVFIVSSFEHSIANMLYFSISYGRLLPPLEVWGFLLVITLANSMGSVLLPMAAKAAE